jgi:hypothetical protein
MLGLLLITAFYFTVYVVFPLGFLYTAVRVVKLALR